MLLPHTEITPSQCGLRILGTTRGIESLHRKKAHPDGQGSFELYVNAGRYITVSGHLLSAQMRELADITDPMMSLLALCDARPARIRVKPKANGADDTDISAHADTDATAEPIDLESLSLPVVELLTKGTIDGKPIKDRVKEIF